MAVAVDAAAAGPAAVYAASVAAAETAAVTHQTVAVAVDAAAALDAEQAPGHMLQGLQLQD